MKHEWHVHTAQEQEQEQDRYRVGTIGDNGSGPVPDAGAV